jgi:hypothetical protein
MYRNVKDLMRVWSQQKPEKTGGKFLIWIRGSGFQIMEYGKSRIKGKPEPYFYWCGSPKKVLWLELKE